MRWNIQNWIEEVKEKPEHIRHRYVIGCVSASMFFVVIVWSLTVSENFKKTVAKKDGTATSGGMLPKPSDFSLDDILSGEESLDAAKSKSSEEFLREQGESRARIDPNETGVVPKEDMPTDADTTTPVR